MNGFDILARGGVFLVPIVLVSLVGATLFVERLLYLRTSRVLGPSAVLRTLAQQIASRDLAALQSSCEQLVTPLGRTLARGLHALPATTGELREALEGVGRAELFLMKRRTGALSAMATVSPLLGLLGTVVGMIAMFQGVVSNAQANARTPDVGALADGIWEALLTTAAGLVVAIPLYLGHRYLIGKIGAHVHQIESFGRSLVDSFASKSSPREEP